MRVIPLLALMAGMFLGQSSVLPGGQLQRVSVTVRDGTGGLVHGLSAEDFLIEEDGEPQTIAAFHRDPKIPVSLGILIARHGFLGFGSSRIFLRTAAAPGDELALMVPARRAFGVKVPFTADPMSIETGILELYDPERFWGRTEPSTVEQIRRALKVMGDARHSRKGLVVFGWDFEGNQGILRDVRAAEVPVYMMRTGGVWF
jgi:hypothetical protein